VGGGWVGGCASACVLVVVAHFQSARNGHTRYGQQGARSGSRRRRQRAARRAGSHLVCRARPPARRRYCYIYIYTHSLTHSLSFSLSLADTHTQTNNHTHTQTHRHRHRHRHRHTHTHTHTQRMRSHLLVDFIEWPRVCHALGVELCDQGGKKGRGHVRVCV
jgi:hypothetical protein